MRLAKGARIVEVLKQNRSQPVPVEKQVAIIYAVTRDYLASVPVEKVHTYETGLYAYLDTDAQGAEVMRTIRETGKLEEETEQQLKAVLDAFSQVFAE